VNNDSFAVLVVTLACVAAAGLGFWAVTHAVTALEESRGYPRTAPAGHYCLAPDGPRVLFLGRINRDGDAYVILSEARRTAYVPFELLEDCA